MAEPGRGVGESGLEASETARTPLAPALSPSAPSDATSRPPPAPRQEAPPPRRAVPWSALLTSLAAFALLLHFIRFTPDDLRRMAENYGWKLFVALFGLILLSQMFRALRLRYLLAGASTPGRLLAIALQHQFFANLLPFRVGEAALPLLLKGEGVPMARSLALLVMVRLMDLLALALILSSSLAWLNDALPVAAGEQRPLWLATLTAASLLAALPILARRRLAPLLARWSRHPRFPPLPRREWIQGRLLVFADGLAAMDRRGALFALLLTVGLWASAAAAALLSIALLTPTLSMDQALAGWALLLLLAHLPIHGFAALGTYEASVVVIFTPLGLSAEEALAFALVTHAGQLVIIALQGMLGMMALRRSRLPV